MPRRRTVAAAVAVAMLVVAAALWFGGFDPGPRDSGEVTVAAHDTSRVRPQDVQLLAPRSRPAEDGPSSVADAPARDAPSGVDGARGFDDPTPQELWNALYTAAEAAVFGGLTPDDVVELARGLLSGLDPTQPPDSVAGGRLTAYPLLDDPAQGTVTLYRRVDSDARYQQNEFVIKAELHASPGYITGYPEDGARSTSLDLHFGFDERDRPVHFSLATQVGYHKSDALFSLLAATGRNVPVGGMLSIRPDESVWRPVAVKVIPGGDGELPEWISTLGEAKELEGSLANEQVASITRMLQATRDS